MEEPPQAVLLWNVIVEHKLLLADVLLDTPLFDVSPGEMYFASLERYFTRSRRPGLPYRDARAYGVRLSGVIVKYTAEAALAEQLLGCPVHVIPNGVTALATRAELGPRERLIIGTAVRIHPDKRIEQLLRAVRIAAPSLPPFVLRIAGGVDRGADDYARELRRESADLPVEWLGSCRTRASYWARSTCSRSSPSRQAAPTLRSRPWAEACRWWPPMSAECESRSSPTSRASSCRVVTCTPSPTR